jgi:hypothetical protein
VSAAGQAQGEKMSGRQRLTQLVYGGLRPTAGRAVVVTETHSW